MRMLRCRSLALLGLVVHAAGALVLPLLHNRHHRDDHRHGENGTLYALSPEGAAPGEMPLHVEAAHRDFDDDLTALELSDAVHFGVAVVDCDLARYTLAACESAGQSPAHTFGDELLARAAHEHRHRPTDPAHGLGSLQHFGLALLAGPPFLLPPPCAPVARCAVSQVATRTGFAPSSPLRARGPPPLLVA